MHTFAAMLAGYVAALLAFLVLDAAWLSLVAVDLFRQQLGAILRDQPNIAAVVVFYLIYACGLTVLAVKPALARSSPGSAAATGGLVGLTAYGTFDLTNLAIISGWTPMLAIVDMTWGTAASAAAASAGYAVAARLSPPDAGLQGRLQS